jgi:uncharacterized phage protein gp47/JayE
MATPVGEAAYPTVAEIRDGILRNLLNYGLQYGITFNVLPGSEHYLVATAIANQFAIAIANNKISNENRNFLTATGTALEDIARAYAVTKRPASPSTGFVILDISGTCSIPLLYQATAPNGKKYIPVTAGVGLVDEDVFEMQSVESGALTVLAPGTILTWDSAAIANLRPTAVVDGGGIDGGTDGDSDEVLRRRLIERLAEQAIGGNASSVRGWAEEPSAAIEAAYVFQGAQGPGSYAFAITKAGTDRTPSDAVVQLAAANVQAKMPGGVVTLNATSVFAEYVDIVFSTILPLPPTSGGTGGGWRDATPWPTEITRITAISGLQLTVNSTTPPVLGNHIGVWDPVAQAMREFEIVSAVTGGVGAWIFSVSGSTSFITAANEFYVSAGAENLIAYAGDALAEINKLGPGEKTDSIELLPRALRFPSPEVVAPYRLTSLQPAGVTALHPEIIGLEYAARYATGTATPLTSASVPPTTADPPRILVLKHLAFIKAS